MMGAYQIALVAKRMDKPVYVAAESYKFARLYPLNQKDMVPALKPIDRGLPIPSKVEVERQQGITHHLNILHCFSQIQQETSARDYRYQVLQNRDETPKVALGALSRILLDQEHPYFSE